MNRLNQYLPHYYDGVLEMDYILEAEEMLFAGSEYNINRILNNQFIGTTDLLGIEEFERMLNIVSNPNTETLQFRRDRILNRLRMTPPFTFRFLKNRLDDLIGIGNWNAYMDYNNYTLYVESASTNQAWYHELLVTMVRVKPANIVFINKPLVHHGIFVNELIEAAKYTYNYRLGTTWALGQKPFADYSSMGVIKLPTISSITPTALGHYATFGLSDVKFAHIVGTNGTATIADTDFITASVTDNVITIEYDTPPSLGIGDITLIELQDANNNQLYSTVVYIPTVEHAIMKHTIKIQEGTI